MTEILFEFVRVVVGQVLAWPAASKTNASWPARQLGRAGEVVR